MLINKTYTIPIRRKQAPFEQERDKTLISHISSYNPDQNPNIFYVKHQTHYAYSAPVNHSKHLFRLQPVIDQEQTVLNYAFDISVKGGKLINFTGAFGNHASFLEINEPYTELIITSQSVVCIQEPPMPSEFLHQPRTLPMIWMPWDRVMMQAYLQIPELPEAELFELAAYAMSFVNKNHNDAYAIISEINETIYREFSYVPGFTSVYTTPYEVYSHRKGVCQDFANLLICLARLLGMPARYRVGYIYTHSEHENQIQSSASHAWAEIFFPYIGWVGFDPTNNCLAQKDHIKIAVGRYYNDATPTSGTLFETESHPEESLSIDVQVIKLN